MQKREKFPLKKFPRSWFAPKIRGSGFGRKKKKSAKKLQPIFHFLDPGLLIAKKGHFCKKNEKKKTALFCTFFQKSIPGSRKLEFFFSLFFKKKKKSFAKKNANFYIIFPRSWFARSFFTVFLHNFFPRSWFAFSKKPIKMLFFEKSACDKLVHFFFEFPRYWYAPQILVCSFEEHTRIQENFFQKKCYFSQVSVCKSTKIHQFFDYFDLFLTPNRKIAYRNLGKRKFFTPPIYISLTRE